jgi:Leucine Rich repeat
MRYRLRTLLQFRLGTLLLAVTVFGVWLGIQVNRANRQRRAIAAIEAARGVIRFDYQRDANGQRIPDAEPPGPRWLRKWIGDDYFRKVVAVDFAFGHTKGSRLPSVDDDRLRCFESLPDVERIELGHNRAVTDDGLARLRNLKKLDMLWLYDCNITGTGLKHLAHLPNLYGLDLRGAPITHEGVIAIAQVQNLRSLWIPETPITDDDLAALKPLVRLESLNLQQTPITDNGLIHLESLTGLQQISLPAHISDEAMKRLQQALPHCQVGRVRQRP